MRLHCLIRIKWSNMLAFWITSHTTQHNTATSIQYNTIQHNISHIYLCHQDSKKPNPTIYHYINIINHTSSRNTKIQTSTPQLQHVLLKLAPSSIQLLTKPLWSTSAKLYPLHCQIHQIHLQTRSVFSK
jgi:hypothetical protein